MKKLLYIVTVPDWGGAQRYIFDLAGNLKNDLDITVAFGQKENNDRLSQKCRTAKIKTHQFKSLVRPINLFRDLAALFEIKNFLKKEKPDLVHLNSSKAGIVGSLAAVFLKQKPKIVYTVHGWVFLEPINYFKKYLYIFLEKLASRLRHQIIVLGRKEKDIALEYKICPPEKLKILPHSIAPIEFFKKEEAREKLGLPPDKKIIGAIANFYPSKGLKYLIEAAKKINDQNIIFVVIGGGALKINYELQITNDELENKMKLLDEIEEAARYLNAFDVFVLSSLKEGSPYVILEAMEANLPIAATMVGNIEEMMANYPNKILVPPSDDHQLKTAILNLINLKKEEREDKKSETILNFQIFIQRMKNFYLEL